MKIIAGSYRGWPIAPGGYEACEYFGWGGSMSMYSYFLFGGPRQSPIQFDLESDSSAVALSICLLRDHPDIDQVWIIEDREPVAVRIRLPDNHIGALIDLRAPEGPAVAVCA